MIKLIAKVIILVLVLGVLINDIGLIFLTNYQIEGVAKEAANKAWEERMLTNDYRVSLRAAQEIAAQNKAEVSKFDLEPDKVRIELTKTPNTLILHRISFLKNFVTAVSQAVAPSD